MRRLLGPLTLLALIPAVVAVLLPALASLHGDLVLVVTGGSMTPTLQLGQTLLVQPVDEVVPGQVVSFAAGSGRVTTHRVVELVQDGSLVRTKGDANAAPDPDLTPVAAVFASPDPRFASWGPLVAFAQSRAGRLLLLGPALVLVSLWQVSALSAAQDPLPRRGRAVLVAVVLVVAQLVLAPTVYRSLATFTSVAEVNGNTFTTAAAFP